MVNKRNLIIVTLIAISAIVVTTSFIILATAAIRLTNQYRNGSEFTELTPAANNQSAGLTIAPTESVKPSFQLQPPITVIPPFNEWGDLEFELSQSTRKFVSQVDFDNCCYFEWYDCESIDDWINGYYQRVGDIYCLPKSRPQGNFDNCCYFEWYDCESVDDWNAGHYHWLATKTCLISPTPTPLPPTPFVLIGPRGPQGERGPRGMRGPQGPPGMSGGD